LAFRYIACNRHPDHDTLASFRKRFGKEFQSAFGYSGARFQDTGLRCALS